MTTNEMKTILYNKLQDENCNFSKSDISIRKDGETYKIIIKDYEHCPFRMSFEYDYCCGYIVYLYIDKTNVIYVDSKKDYDIKTALIELGYYIGTRF